MTAPVGWLALELAPDDGETADKVLVRLAKVLPVESVTGPPTMVLPPELVVVTAFLVPVVTALPAELVPITGAPGMPVLATPRKALMADSSETTLGWYCEGTAVR